MANLGAIVRATRASYLALRTLNNHRRLALIAQRELDMIPRWYPDRPIRAAIETAKAQAALASAERRARLAERRYEAAQDVLHANPLPGDVSCAA